MKRRLIDSCRATARWLHTGIVPATQGLGHGPYRMATRQGWSEFAIWQAAGLIAAAAFIWWK
jgi:hypothetical protein